MLGDFPSKNEKVGLNLTPNICLIISISQSGYQYIVPRIYADIHRRSKTTKCCTCQRYFAQFRVNL